MAEESIERGVQGGRINTWWRETIAELRRVVWPTREEAINLTAAVLFVTALMTVILGGADLVFARLVKLLVSIVGGS